MVGSDGVDLLEVREAAAIARRTPETIRRWVWSGRLRAQRRSNRLLVARADLVALLAGPGAEEAASTPSLSFAEWAAIARAAARPEQQETGTSAADLVLADRRRRSDADGASE